MTFIAIMTVFAFIAILFNTLFTLALNKKEIDSLECISQRINNLGMETAKMARSAKELAEKTKDLADYITSRKDD